MTKKQFARVAGAFYATGLRRGEDERPGGRARSGDERRLRGHLAGHQNAGHDRIGFPVSVTQSSTGHPGHSDDRIPQRADGRVGDQSGAAGYVTKPFTPEEITQAVHRFAVQGRTSAVEGESAAGAVPGVAYPVPGTPTRFWHESWLREKADSEYRTGAVLAGLAAQEIKTIRLPRIGEVVWQGLPMASVLLRDGCVRTIPSPLTGIVQSVNLELPQHADWLINDPCGQGWIADVCATRDEEELKSCIARGVLVLASDVEAAERHLKSLQSVGCEARAYVGLGVGRGSGRDGPSSGLAPRRSRLDGRGLAGR